MRAFIEEYHRYFKQTFGIEPQISKNFQIYYSVQRFHSRYTRNTKTFVYYPIKPGVKVVVEIPEDVSKELEEIAKWFLRAQQEQDIHTLRSAIARSFSLAKRARRIYVEIVKEDVAVRVVVRSSVADALARAQRLLA